MAQGGEAPGRMAAGLGKCLRTGIWNWGLSPKGEGGSAAQGKGTGSQQEGLGTSGMARTGTLSSAGDTRLGAGGAEGSGQAGRGWAVPPCTAGQEPGMHWEHEQQGAGAEEAVLLQLGLQSKAGGGAGW